MTLEEMEKRLKITEDSLEAIKKRLRTTEDILEKTEKRLGVVEDIEEIKRLQVHYLNSVMFTDWDAVMDCFVEDSAIEFVEGGYTRGKAEVEKFFRERIARIHVGKEGDFAVHPLISVDGERAKGNWVMYMMYSHPRTGQALFWVQGIYDAEYIKENGRWKFGFLKWTSRMEPPGGPPAGPPQVWPSLVD